MSMYFYMTGEALFYLVSSTRDAPSLQRTPSLKHMFFHPEIYRAFKIYSWLSFVPCLIVEELSGSATHIKCKDAVM